MIVLKQAYIILTYCFLKIKADERNDSMFVITMTKKKITRLIIITLAVLIGVCVLIYAILSSVNANASEKKLPIYSVERNDKKISITFDVAWENSNTQALLDILSAENVKATFFVTGDWCDRYPEDVMKFFKAGHEIQNHSDQHPHVENANVNDLIEDTREASKKIEMITNTTPTLYRAPYGEYDDSMLTTIEGMGMKVIQWDIDSLDWKEKSADYIIKKVVKNTQSGSILLFHNDLENTTEALPEVIKQLKEKGFEFVPVSELIYQENYIIDHTGKQIYQDPALLTFIDSARAKEVLNSDKADEIKEIVLKYMSADEVAALKDGITPEVISSLLSKMSDEDKNKVLALVNESTQTTENTSTSAPSETSSPLIKGEPVETSASTAQTTMPVSTTEMTTTSMPSKGEGIPIETTSPAQTTAPAITSTP